jgi:hypothetical protein
MSLFFLSELRIRELLSLLSGPTSVRLFLYIEERPYWFSLFFFDTLYLHRGQEEGAEMI